MNKLDYIAENQRLKAELERVKAERDKAKAYICVMCKEICKSLDITSECSDICEWKVRR